MVMTAGRLLSHDNAFHGVREYLVTRRQNVQLWDKQHAEAYIVDVNSFLFTLFGFTTLHSHRNARKFFREGFVRTAGLNSVGTARSEHSTLL